MECVHSYIPGTQGVNTSLPGLKAHSTWTPSVDELRLEMRLTTLSLVKKKKKLVCCIKDAKQIIKTLT